MAPLFPLVFVQEPDEMSSGFQSSGIADWKPLAGIRDIRKSRNCLLSMPFSITPKNGERTEIAVDLLHFFNTYRLPLPGRSDLFEFVQSELEVELVI